VAADIPRALSIGKKITCPPSEVDILEGTDKAWEQYKKGKGTRVTSTDELNALLDGL